MSAQWGTQKAVKCTESARSQDQMETRFWWYMPVIPSPWKAEARESEVQSLSGLENEFKAMRRMTWSQKGKDSQVEAQG